MRLGGSFLILFFWAVVGWEEVMITPIVWIRVKKMKWKRCTKIEVYCRVKLFLTVALQSWEMIDVVARNCTDGIAYDDKR
ncbi:UNVERIFIED_CONTAM: hypothetical protein Sindi_2677200 [Sesamum indicum]